MRGTRRAVATALSPVLLAACMTHVGTVVLLPDPDARQTAVIVHESGEQLVLDEPYAAADLTGFAPRRYTSSAAEVQARFGPALAAQPDRPVQFTLYFVEGTDTPTDESSQLIDAVFAEIARRSVPDIVVVGHTDLSGSDEFNDALARRRADAVRSTLIGRGVAPGHIVAIGRGKREPAVRTPDGAVEPRNRRVEILVR